MVHQTSAYHTKLSSTISARALQKWEQEITSAESRRLEDPRAIDIIGTQVVDINAGSGPLPSPLTGVVPEWLNLALSIEERQYGVSSIVHLFFSEISEQN